MIRTTTAAVALVALLVAGGCGSTGGIELRGTPTTPAPSAVPPPSTTAAPAATTDPALPAESWIANVRAGLTEIRAHDGIAGITTTSIPSPLPSGAPTTFLVKQRAVAAADGSLWHEVYLPVRPNGSTGWVADADVVLTNTSLAAVVHLDAHRLDLADGGTVVASYPVAVGLPDTPTPTGRYYVKELVRPPSPTGAYGPYAYGLSAFSPTLVDTEAFADGVIGIHGTNQPELIGTDVSHGCVRMTNDDLLALKAREIPLGMPVTIVA